MTELETWFGPRQAIDKAQAKPTQWPKAEERLRDILDTFCDVRGFMPSSPFERKQLIAGARDFVDSLGERPDLLREAMHDYHARGKGYMVATPRSLISWCRQWLLEHDADRQMKKFETPANKEFFDA